MRILNPVNIRGVGHLGVVCLLTFLLLPRLSFGQVEQDETVGVPPGVPPGKDIGGDRGVGMPPTSKLKQAVQRDGKFHLLEATIDDIHSALQKREITCDALIRLYFKRIKTYSGHCVKYDKNGDGISPDYDLFMPSGKGVYLGVVSAIPNAGKVNAIQSVNLRPANGFNKLRSRLLEQK